jgi:tape measure domain-containing protein
LADGTRTLQIIIQARDEASKVLKSFGSSFGDMAKDAQIGSAAILGGLTLMGKGAIDAGSQLQQARIAFNTMTGDAKVAGDLLQKLSDFAVSTPFTFPSIVEGSKRLLAYNIEAKDLLPTMKMLGDITAGVGTDKMPQLILAFGQVKAATRLTGAELRQFSEAGVPLLDTLAKQANVTAAEMTGMISDKAVSFDMVRDALASLTGEGGKFFNLMDAQSKTFGGTISNITDNLFRMGAAFVGVTVTGEVIAGGLFDRLAQAATQLLNVLNQLTPQISGFMNTFLTNTPMVTAVLGALLGLLTPLALAFAAMIAPALLFAAAGMAIGLAIGFFIQKMQEGSPWVIAIGAALGAVAGLIFATVIPAFIAWGIAAVSAAIATIIALAPVILIAAAVGAAVALLYFAWQHNFLGIQQITSTVVNWFRSTAWPIIQAVFGFIVDAVENMAGVWISRFNAIVGAINAVIGALRSMIDMARSAASAVAGGLKIPGFQHGGFVPGAYSQPVPAILHGGERVISRTGVDVNNGGTGGGGGVTINFNGSVALDSDDRVKELADRIISVLGRQNELAGKGLAI